MEKQIITIIAEQLGLDEAEVKLESKFIEDLGADSLDIVDLLMKLDDTFDVQISDEETAELKTVSDAVTFVESVTR